MRLGILFFLVFLAVIYQNQCEETTTVAESDAGDNQDNSASTASTPEPAAEKNEDDKGNNDDGEESESDNTETKCSKRRKSCKKPDSLGHMNIFLKGQGKGSKKQKTIRIRLPVARYNPKRYPRFGSLTTFLPWLPIYVEKRSKQTVIYSPTGGVYILPPVVNFYGKLISVGELIVTGYASLVSTGAPPPASVDISSLVQSGSIAGPNMPSINPMTGVFNGAVTADFRAYPSNGYYGYY